MKKQAFCWILFYFFSGLSGCKHRTAELDEQSSLQSYGADLDSPSHLSRVNASMHAFFNQTDYVVRCDSVLYASDEYRAWCRQGVANLQQAAQEIARSVKKNIHGFYITCRPPSDPQRYTWSLMLDPRQITDKCYKDIVNGQPVGFDAKKCLESLSPKSVLLDEIVRPQCYTNNKFLADSCPAAKDVASERCLYHVRQPDGTLGCSTQANYALEKIPISPYVFVKTADWSTQDIADLCKNDPENPFPTYVDAFDTMWIHPQQVAQTILSMFSTLPAYQQSAKEKYGFIKTRLDQQARQFARHMNVQVYCPMDYGEWGANQQALLQMAAKTARCIEALDKIQGLIYLGYHPFDQQLVIDIDPGKQAIAMRYKKRKVQISFDMLYIPSNTFLLHLKNLVAEPSHFSSE